MWIESHQSLGHHPKTKRLARRLGVALPTAVGHLHYLWWWALDYARDGHLSRYEDADIADAALWTGDASAFVEALMHAGFMDADRTLHDWGEYAGRLIERRERDKQRYREWRERRKLLQSKGDQESPTDSERVRNVSPTSEERTENVVTGPDRTIPNRTNYIRNDHRPSPADRSSAGGAVIDTPIRKTRKGSRGPKQEYPPEFEAAWSVYPRKLAKRAAYRAWRARLKDKLDDGSPITAEMLWLAARRYAEACYRERTEPRYILHASTFWGPQHRFVDFLAPDSSVAPPPRRAQFLAHPEVVFEGEEAPHEPQQG